MQSSSVPSLAAVLIGAADPEVVALEDALRHAQLTADVHALDALLADDLLFTGPDGQLGTKAQDIGAHASGIVRFRRHDATELRIRRVGLNVAMCALCTELEVDVAGVRTGGRFRYTRVWAREDAASWRVVGGHVAAVPGDAAG